MTADTRNPQDRTDSDLNGESDPANIAQHWVDHGADEDVDDGETRFFAVQQTIERELADPETLAGKQSGRGESVTIHVLYARQDGHRAIERDYDARVQDLGDRTIVDPAALASNTPGEFYSSVAVGEDSEPFGISQSEDVLAALEELHDVEVAEEGGA